MVRFSSSRSNTSDISFSSVWCISMGSKSVCNTLPHPKWRRYSCVSPSRRNIQIKCCKCTENSYQIHIHIPHNLVDICPLYEPSNFVSNPIPGCNSCHRNSPTMHMLHQCPLALSTLWRCVANECAYFCLDVRSYRNVSLPHSNRQISSWVIVVVRVTNIVVYSPPANAKKYSVQFAVELWRRWMVIQRYGVLCTFIVAARRAYYYRNNYTIVCAEATAMCWKILALVFFHCSVFIVIIMIVLQSCRCQLSARMAKNGGVAKHTHTAHSTHDCVVEKSGKWAPQNACNGAHNVWKLYNWQNYFREYCRVFKSFSLVAVCLVINKLTNHWRCAAHTPHTKKCR